MERHESQSTEPQVTEDRVPPTYSPTVPGLMWPPPNRVADAIFDADGAAARQGRIDYVNETVDTGRSGEPPRNFGSEKWKRAVLALNGFNDDDLRRFLPADLDKLKLMRDEAIKAGLDRVKTAIEEMKPGQDWNLPG